MTKTIYLALALGAGQVTLTLAQTATPTITSIWFPIPEGEQPYDASLIGQDSTATTLAIVCASPTPSDCNFPSPMTITIGPSTFHHKPQETDIWNIIGEIDCVLTRSGADGAVCANTAGVYDEDMLNSATTRSDNGWLDISTRAPSSETSTVSWGPDGPDGAGYITVTVVGRQEEEGTATVTGESMGSSTSVASASGSGSGSESATAAVTSAASVAASASATAAGNGASNLGGLAGSGIGVAVAGLLMALL